MTNQKLSQKDFIGNYDLSRSDKMYSVKFPKYFIQNTVVYYEINLKDLISNEFYTITSRFKDLKTISDKISSIYNDAPIFPKTNFWFWIKTNQNPDMIQSRRIGLQIYFESVFNDPFIRGSQPVRELIAKFKRNKTRQIRNSTLNKLKQNIETISRSYSNDKSTAEILSREEWKSLNEKQQKRIC